MAKQILFNEKARRALKNGIDKAANTIKITLGPRGRNVALDKGYGGPTITNDGVSIAKEITLRVLNGGDGYLCDHAAWAGARFLEAGAKDVEF